MRKLQTFLCCVLLSGGLSDLPPPHRQFYDGIDGMDLPVLRPPRPTTTPMPLRETQPRSLGQEIIAGWTDLNAPTTLSGWKHWRSVSPHVPTPDIVLTDDTDWEGFTTDSEAKDLPDIDAITVGHKQHEPILMNDTALQAEDPREHRRHLDRPAGDQHVVPPGQRGLYVSRQLLPFLVQWSKGNFAKPSQTRNIQRSEYDQDDVGSQVFRSLDNDVPTEKESPVKDLLDRLFSTRKTREHRRHNMSGDWMVGNSEDTALNRDLARTYNLEQITDNRYSVKNDLPERLSRGRTADMAETIMPQRMTGKYRMTETTRPDSSEEKKRDISLHEQAEEEKPTVGTSATVATAIQVSPAPAPQLESNVTYTGPDQVQPVKHDFVKHLTNVQFSWVDIIIAISCSVAVLLVLINFGVFLQYCIQRRRQERNFQVETPSALGYLPRPKLSTLCAHLDDLGKVPRARIRTSDYGGSGISLTGHSVATQYENTEAMIANFINNDLIVELNDRDSTCTSLSDGFTYSHDYDPPSSPRSPRPDDQFNL